MYTNGYFGVPNPSGLRKLSGTENIPKAENIERTMYWLDRVAEQHGWTQHYPSDPLIRPSGFNWKRHNGLELETFDPVDSGNFRLKGYPISSQDFWNNFREIITWAGSHILRQWDAYGGQVSGLRGMPNSSGYQWNYTGDGYNEQKWLNYGNYKDGAGTGNDTYSSTPILNNSGENSFVDFNKSSSTEYMGRHGNISRNDYNQYVPFPRSKHTFIGYPYWDAKCVTVTKFVLKKNFNTIPNNFKISRNELLTGTDLTQVQQMVSDVWNSSGVGTVLIYPSSFFGDENLIMSETNNSFGGYSKTDFPYGLPMINGYSLTRKQAIDGRVLLEPAITSGLITRPNSGPSDGNACIPFVESVGGNSRESIPDYALKIAAIPFGNNPQNNVQWDVLDYDIDSSGFLISSNVITVQDRYVRGETREAEGLTGFVCKNYLGVFFPLSTKYYSSSSGDRYDNNDKNYLRSFTGFTPNDSLDLISSINNYGPDGYVSGVNSYSYNNITYDYNQSQTGGKEYFAFPPFFSVCSGNLNTVNVSSLVNNVTNQTFDINKDYDLKLVYGFVDYEIVSGVSPVLSVKKLITESIEASNYTDIADIMISGGYTSISYSSNSLVTPHAIFYIGGLFGFQVPGVMVAPPGNNYFKEDYWAGTANTHTGFSNVTGTPTVSELYERIGSLSGLTDFTPTGNILYLAIINPDDVLSDFMSESMPALNYLDEQDNITVNESYYFRSPMAGDPITSVRFIGTAAGSYSYSVYGCEMQNSGSFDTDNNFDYPTRLRSFGYKERSSTVLFQTDQKIGSTLYNSGAFPIGKGVHSSYGAINDGDDKIQHNLNNIMTLYTDTYLFQ